MTNDGQQFSEGSEGQPIPADSAGNDKPSSETVNIPKTEWENIQKTIKRLDDETRSNKDRAVKKTNERLDEFEERFQSTFDRVYSLMEQHGISKEAALGVVKQQDEEAETKAYIREIRETLKSGVLPTSTTPGSGVPSGGKVAEVVKEFGLDENDTEVIDIYRRFNDPSDQEKAVLRLAASRARKENPSVSASPTIQGRPNAPAGIEQLTKEYQKNMIAAAGNKAKVKELKDAARKAGVPVDSIVFA